MTTLESQPDVPESSTFSPVLLDDPDVAAALAEHERAEVALIEAKQRREAAIGAVRDTLFAAGKRFRDRREPIPRADVSRLYWDHRQLRVSDLAAAFGVSKKELVELAGPRADHAPCMDCKQSVPIMRSSRSNEQHVRCERCRAAELEHQVREREREHELDLERVRRGEALIPRPSPWDYRDW